MKAYTKPAISVLEYNSESIITVSGLRTSANLGATLTEIPEYDGVSLKY